VLGLACCTALPRRMRIARGTPPRYRTTRARRSAFRYGLWGGFFERREPEDNSRDQQFRIVSTPQLWRRSIRFGAGFRTVPAHDLKASRGVPTPSSQSCAARSLRTVKPDPECAGTEPGQGGGGGTAQVSSITNIWGGRREPVGRINGRHSLVLFH